MLNRWSVNETQFYVLVSAIVAGLGGIASVIRWSVTRIVKALDGNSTHMLENTKTIASFTTKLDMLHAAVVPQQAQLPAKRARTNPHGVALRPVSNHADDEDD